MKNKKIIMIGILCALVCVMAVGYALLAQELNINGRASIDSTWKVEITNITEKDIVGDASSKETPSYTSTTANFSVGLIQSGDSITYDIEVTNSGTLDAVLESIDVSMNDNDAIIYTTSGLKKGAKLAKNGGKNTLTIKVEYNAEVTSQPTNTGKELTVTLSYEQDLGQVVAYDYVIGDQISFAGSNWYVIKNSSNEEDYVTLMKEKVLSSTELGEYAYNDTYDTMAYYWSDTCHDSNSYGWTSYDDSGCEGHNDYEESKVKEYLEGTYINMIGETNLTEVDGYKIRLITTDELNQNLGWVNLNNTAKTDNENANVPIWIYQNLNVSGYWTMTPHSEYSSNVLIVFSGGDLRSMSVCDGSGSIRPVINLLKSSI